MQRSTPILAALALLVGTVAQARADFVHTFTTDASVTIGDDNPPILNAIYEGPEGGGKGQPNNSEHWGIIEFDISTLSGISLTSAKLQLFTDTVGGNKTLRGFYGNGTIGLNDWYNIGNVIATLPTKDNPFDNVDVTQFLQGVINADANYAGFVIWQSPSKAHGGNTFEGGDLVLAAPADFAIPGPLESPIPSLPGDSPVTTPEPSALTLLGIGAVSLIGYGWRRRKLAAA